MAATAAAAGATTAAAAAAAAAMTAAEYSAQVEAWMRQAYHFQMMAFSFPSYLAYQATVQQQQQQQRPPGQQSQANSFFRPQPQQQPQQQQQQQQQPQFHEFRIPPLWKRFAAEFLDFLALFVIKLAVTFVAVDTFELIDFESFISKYDSGLLSVVSGEEVTVDMNAAFELTWEIVLLEMIHRVVVCAFETVCTYRGPRGTQGGATPGKLFMGLRIYRCDQISLTGAPDRVRVSPATDLGLFWAGLRAVLKNMSMAFLFPVSVTFLFLPFNRTVYDVMSRSIVVEVERPSQRQRHQQQQQQQQQQQRRQ